MHTSRTSHTSQTVDSGGKQKETYCNTGRRGQSRRTQQSQSHDFCRCLCPSLLTRSQFDQTLRNNHADVSQWCRG